MADPSVTPSVGRSYWKKLWNKLPNTCFSKKILLLLVWYLLFIFSANELRLNAFRQFGNTGIMLASECVAYCFAPLVGWLADVKFGRYEMIKFGSLVSFLASILYYFALLTTSTLSDVLFSGAVIITNLGGSCYFAAMLPFLTDQIIGATSDELSAFIRWYLWTLHFGHFGVCMSELHMYIISNYVSAGTEIVLFFVVPLAVIIISDCLCQQWLDRTHKVTNPIKLIIQVLNYTRKHRYPERRSAFTYIDEEQPTRMDYGKEKFGGPFTEEEVEDVKTVLRLIPLVICLSLIIGAHGLHIVIGDFEFLINDWLFPLLLIPFYQFMLRPCFRSCVTSTLQRIKVALLMGIIGLLLLCAMEVYEFVSGDIGNYNISCGISIAPMPPESYVSHLEWYWKVGPYLLFGIGSTIVAVLFLEFMISQSPDKMKGLVIGISIPFSFILSSLMDLLNLTLCHNIITVTGTVVLFVVFLVLSKRYTLRERNREINIQAIVEEHYERYMDQEEEYMRQPHY